MKKTISIIVLAALVLAFAGCGQTREKAVDLNEVMADIAANAQMPQEVLTLETANDLMDYYGIDAALAESFAICMNASGYQDEIIMIKGVNAEATAEIEQALKAHLEDSIEAMSAYSPEQYEILQQSHVNVNGSYVSLFVSSDSAKMIEIYNSYFA